MATLFNDPKLFGLDLRAVWQEARHAWRCLERSWALSWVQPTPLVRLVQLDGSETVWQAGAALSPRPGAAARQARFLAVELPTDLVLQRQLTLPGLPDEQVQSAVALEVQGASPFAPDDLVWGWRSQEQTPGRQLVDVVIASRKQVEGFLDRHPRRVGPASSVEVWVRLADRPGAVVLSGFGENPRFGRTARWRRAGYALLVLAVLSLTAIAATPTAQLRLRAIDAVNSYTALFQRVQPLVGKREALVKSTERLASARELTAAGIDAPRVMDLLTRVLPDDTVLQNLQVDGSKVSLTGQADNAAALMKKLSGEPGLLDVRAPSPAMRAPGTNKEVFRIDFTLDRKAAAAPAGASAPGPSGGGAKP